MERIKTVEERMQEKWREEWSYYREDSWTRRPINELHLKRIVFLRSTEGILITLLCKS